MKIKFILVFALLLFFTGCVENPKNDSNITKIEEQIHIEAYLENLISYLDNRFGTNNYLINPHLITDYDKVGKYNAKVYVESTNILYDFIIDYSDSRGPTVVQKNPIILYKGVKIKDHPQSLTYLIENSLEIFDESGNVGIYSPENEDEYFPTDEEKTYFVPWYVSDGINQTDISLEVHVVNPPSK